MPYSSVDDLPSSVRTAIPEKDKQEKFVATFNNCMKSGGGGDEKRCFRVAYSAAQNFGKRVRKTEEEVAWEDGEIVRKLVFEHLSKESVEKHSNKQLNKLWNRLNKWYRTSKRLGKSTDAMSRASLFVIDELRKRGADIESNELVREAAPSYSVLKVGEVPLHNPLSPVVFVVSKPNSIEKARQEYLIGPDGKVFNDLYLTPLGLTKSDVMVIDVSQLAWLNYVEPTTIVALGKGAKRSLGSTADYTMPHPNAIRRFGDSGEVGRKIRAILKNWDEKKPENSEGLQKSDEFLSFSGGAFVKTGRNFVFTGGSGAGGGVVATISSTDDPLINLESTSIAKNDVGLYNLGLAYNELIELRLDGTHNKGRYLLKFESVGDNFAWKIEKPSTEIYFADQNDAATLKSKLIKKLGVVDNSWMYWGNPGESRKIDFSSTDKSIPIIKTDDERRIVYGVVLDPYQVDAHDDWISPKEIEDTAHQWMANSRTIGFNHEDEAKGAEVVESWLVPYPDSKEYKLAMDNADHKAYTMPYGNDEVHSGSWVLGTRLSEKDWQLVKEGKLNAYSIGGYGRREPTSVEKMPQVEFIRLSGEGQL